MKNIAIVCDSSVALELPQIKDINVKVVPLTLIQGNNEFFDQVDITHDQVNQLLRDGEPLKTSQPSPGIIMDLFEALKKENYDAIFVLTLSSFLSGTYASFHQGIEATGIENVHLIDSFSLAGPVQQGIALIHKLNEQGESIDVILERLNHLFSNTKSYVYPESLDRLKLSGRISKSAAMMASLLKVKPLLALDNHGSSIEKFGTARTESKIFDLIIDDLIKHNVKPDTHDIYFLENMGYLTVARLKTALFDRIGIFKYSVSKIPAVVSAHAGLGTIAIQWIEKI